MNLASCFYDTALHIFFLLCKMLFLCPQQIGLLISSFLNALLSAACCTGVILAISITVTHQGKGLMLGCNETVVPINARSPVGAQCPFDSTRIYVSANWRKNAHFFDILVTKSLLLNVRIPPWLCGSPVPCCRLQRWDCRCGASSLLWLSEDCFPVGTDTSKSRCVSLRGVDRFAGRVCLIFRLTQTCSQWFKHKTNLVLELPVFGKPGGSQNVFRLRVLKKKRKKRFSLSVDKMSSFFYI